MSLIYITGNSGAGKSTIRKALEARGYEAYDTDDGFKSWYNKEKNTLGHDQKRWEDTTIEWRRLYWLKTDRSKVARLADNAKKQPKPTFLCGIGPNDNEIWDLFDTVVHLSLNDEQLKERLAHRKDNDYGKHPDDLKNILSWNKDIDMRNKGYGAIIIDANQSLEQVVNEILEKIR